MNPVLESRAAKLLHFLAHGAPLPYYLASTGARTVGSFSSGATTLYEKDRTIAARVLTGRGLFIYPQPGLAASLHAAAPDVFDIESMPTTAPPTTFTAFLDPGVDLAPVIGPLGVAAYRATWRTRLKHQKVRQPW